MEQSIFFLIESSNKWLRLLDENNADLKNNICCFIIWISSKIYAQNIIWSLWYPLRKLLPFLIVYNEIKFNLRKRKFISELKSYQCKFAYFDLIQNISLIVLYLLYCLCRVFHNTKFTECLEFVLLLFFFSFLRKLFQNIQGN